MNFEEITADEVKNELEKLIWEYPDRYGSLPDDDLACTYYMDERGEPLALLCGVSHETMNLVTPVCIVGMWVERFHPELKDDPLFSRLLRRNTPMRDVTNTETPLNRDVIDILAEAQEQQDRNIPWSQIKL